MMILRVCRRVIHGICLILCHTTAALLPAPRYGHVVVVSWWGVINDYSHIKHNDNDNDNDKKTISHSTVLVAGPHAGLL